MRALQQSLRVLSRGLATTAARRTGISMKEPASGFGVVPKEEGYKKMMQLQTKLAEANDQFVWKRGGNLDMTLYNVTIVGCIVCLLYCGVEIWDSCWPKKNQE